MGRNLKFIHSFSTRPLALNCYGVDGLRRLIGNIWYFSLSMAYIRKFGEPIELHTDSLGKALLGHLPYDNIHLTLDDMPEDLHPRFWAAGKIWALGASDIGSVHIDGDVFIKRQSLIDEIKNSDWDFIAQQYESSEWYENESFLFDRYPEIASSRGLEVHRNGGYNTGVIGFRDAILRDAFVNNYKAISLALSKKAWDTLTTSTFFTPDLILEQRHASQISRSHGAKVHLILPDGQRIQETAIAKGYQHVLTLRKFDDLSKCQRTLEVIDPEIYNQTKRLCPKF